MRALPFVATGAFAAVLLALAGPASAQSTDGFERCGAEDLALVFMNPDLGVQDDGFVHASGMFFIQFQARGEKAFDIETFKFSFGKPTPASTCASPEWVTGAYLKNYRADYDWRDGFFVPINTCNVPNGEYAAAISAYDKDLNELVRYYTKAIVTNGEGNNAEERCKQADTTKPWPMILPGDGERTDGGQGLYVEVGEEITSIEAFVNGVKVQLTQGEGPARDDDNVPDLGYTPTLRDTPLANSVLATRRYPAFTWDGHLEMGSVVKVVVADKWGNVAEKVVHLGDPTIGGRVTLAHPEFELKVDPTDQTANAAGYADYNVTYVTKTEEGLHADLYVRGEDGGNLPEGITYRLTPNHVMMGGNEDLPGTIRLIATPQAKPGAYKVQFIASYLSGEQRLEKNVLLTFRVDAPPRSDYTESEERATGDAILQPEVVRDGKLDNENVTPAEDDGDGGKKKGIPAAPLGLVLAGLAGVATLRRRRA